MVDPGFLSYTVVSVQPSHFQFLKILSPTRKKLDVCLPSHKLSSIQCTLNGQWLRCHNSSGRWNPWNWCRCVSTSTHTSNAQMDSYMERCLCYVSLNANFKNSFLHFRLYTKRLRDTKEKYRIRGTDLSFCNSVLLCRLTIVILETCG